jgi:hypothetical protein
MIDRRSDAMIVQMARGRDWGFPATLDDTQPPYAEFSVAASMQALFECRRPAARPEYGE